MKVSYINLYLLRLSQCIHFLPEPEHNIQPTIQNGNSGSSLVSVLTY